MPHPRLLGKRIEHLRVVDEFYNCLYQFSLDRERRVPKSTNADYLDLVHSFPDNVERVGSD